MKNLIKVRSIPELDTLRFIAIFLVIGHHAFFTDNFFLSWLSRHGYVGVDIFFTLSGFIITKSLLSEYEQNGTIELKKFWVKRIFRLWPNWFASMILSSCILYIFALKNLEIMEAIKNKLWHYFFHFANYSQALNGKLHDIFSIYWSLAVEEHFYLLWPLIFLYIIKFPKSKNFLFLIFLLFPYLFRVLHKFQGFDDVINTFSTHTRFDALMFGCILAFIWKKIPNYKGKFENYFLIATSLVTMFIGLQLKFYDGSYFISQLAHTFRALSTFTFIIFIIKGSGTILHKLFKSKFISKLGVLSYGAYLFHYIINVFIFKFLSIKNLQINQSIIFIGMIISTHIFSFISYKFIELPFIEYRKKFI